MDFNQNLNDEENCAIYIEELRSDDPNIRINAASKIFYIAEIIGAQRIKEELIPYLTEIIEEKDNDDEFLVKVVEHLGKIASLLNDEDIHLLLGALEIMASMEEPIVREKAVESIIKISEGQSKEFFSNSFLNMLKRLAIWDNYPSRISACPLFSVCYPHVKPAEQLEIRQLYSELAHDDTPMVRRAAAACIKNMISVLDHDIVKSEIIPIFNKLIKDDIDSVKINSIENSIYMLTYYNKNEISDNLISLLKNVDPENKSWRVRFSLAECLIAFASQLDKETVIKDIFPIYESMLKDQEQEVRSCATLKLPELYEKLSDDQLQNHLIPILSQLINDPSLHVRISVAQAVPELASSMNTTDLIKLVLPLIQSLYKDEIAEVRIALIQHLKLFNKVIGVDNIKAHIIPMITSYNSEKQWRSKLSLLEALPDICIDMGYDAFKEELCTFTFNFLNDHIYTIREQTILNIDKLIRAYGYNRLKQQIINSINDLINSTNYLFRMTGISAFIQLYDHFDENTSDDILNKIIDKLGKDEVPNVKFNVVKLAINLKNKIQKYRLKQLFNGLLERLVQDKDPDVSYYAKTSLEKINDP